MGTLIRERTAAGLAEARRRGRKGGRPPAFKAGDHASATCAGVACFGYVHAQHLAPRAAADVQHALARRGRGGFNRGLAKRRQHGVEPGLVSDPALPALAIPVGDLIGILLCHAISSSKK
ncbi:MAG TPA: hypothetical protein VJ756_13585 [Terriglobales bacterium]|nr:hypothetical protein [Terriglobales bacterium]